VLSALIFQNTEISGVGASGALFGLLGVLAVLVPNSKIYLIAGPLIVIVIQAVAQALVPASLASAVLAPINIIANIIILIMIFAIFSFNLRIRKISVPLELPMWLLPVVAIVPLSVIALFINLPIGNSAHVGGLVAGLLYGFYLRHKYKRKVKLLSRYFR
ncbi:rhomboid family intramembrane serine protease, partial [Candidatus Pacearchaeota archaeon]|nr:rhomboid family intramembrane serine protease [Candidatus Pacearchaeota archaeon]